MIITICGSMKFAREMLEAKRALEEMGHTAHVARDTEQCVENSGLAQDVEHCTQNDVMRYHFSLIERSDAVLVLNYHKNGVDNYVGPNTLIDMGVAHYLGKKIILLNSPPELSCKVEIQLMSPVLLEGDLRRIE
ncbi:MAG: hypothetical protein ACE5FW_01360 [Candidatus Aenigmatarchaeota archaeon]